MACLWIFCIAISLFGDHGPKASISLSSDHGKSSGMTVVVTPSRLPTHQQHSHSKAPLHSPHIHKRKKWHHGHPSHNQGPFVSPADAPKHSPSPTPTNSYVYAPYKPPVQSPSKSIPMHPTSPLPHPVKSLPPPPPNLVAELAQEIAIGVSMELSQVHIMGANAASGEPEKTVVLINLVPRGEKFDNITALLTFEKFWQKKVFIKAPFFGNYDVLSVLYPASGSYSSIATVT